MIEKAHSQLSIRRQAKLLRVNRNRLDRPAKALSQTDEAIMKELDEIYTAYPFYGQRKLRLELRDHGRFIGRTRLRRLMRVMGIEALVPKAKLNTSASNPEHKIYPYLLRDREMTQADEVWCADITYIPMREGHVYLVAIMDWATRAVLSWEVSNTMDVGFCVRALRRAFAQTGRQPKIFNTDQGSQFTSREWVGELQSRGIQVSMDGKGRWMDNVFIERLWRSLKYERLRLWSYQTPADVRTHVDEWMQFYNHERKHQGLAYQRPWELYDPQLKPTAIAA